jgi:hypothetical protein
VIKALKLMFVLAVFVGVVITVRAWVEARRDAEALKRTIATQKSVLDGADADERENAIALQKALSQIDALRRRVRTPVQAAQGLNQILPLPTPIDYGAAGVSAQNNQLGAITTTTRAPSSTNDTTKDLPESPKPKSDKAEHSATLPEADLIPLYNYTQECRACTLELDAARNNVLDGQKKIAALTAERDAAIRTAHNRGVIQHVRDSVLWIAVGIAVDRATSALSRTRL